MKLRPYLQRGRAWINLSAPALIALLQRSPALRGVAAAEEYAAASPIGAIIRSAAIAVASLGAIDAKAGATLLASSLTPDPTGPLPTFYSTVGTEITPVAFTIANLIAIGSWKIVGEIPPGLTLTTLQPNGGSVTGFGGDLDATTDDNPLTTPILEGTPTVAGTYKITMQGFWKGGESGGPFMGKGISSPFPFTIVVEGTAPVFTTQPISVTVSGGTVALNAVATAGSTYQWMLNGSTPVAGATSPTLLISDAAAAAGAYTCVATNALGSVTSHPAALSLSSTNDIGRLVNISTRATVGTGANILIAGFTVGGSGTTGSESLLVRGSGPALGQFGVAGTLPDPQLKFFGANLDGTSTQLDSNAGWNADPQIAAASTSLGAFSWGNASTKDSAILTVQPKGSYTAQISGQGGDTGVALAEVYDATPAGAYTPATPRITNISARVQVGTGANILIAGFAIGGSTSRTVLIRASGPGLVQFGVTGILPDPMLQVYSGATLVAENSGWDADPQISTTANSVGGFEWKDLTSIDSALIIALPPGSYTAQVSGMLGDTGVALVEVYEVP